MPEQSYLSYDFFFIGQELPAYAHMVSAEEIDHFCHSMRESNSVYLDDEFARKAGFESRIAPPMMVRRYAHMQNVLAGFGTKIPGHSIHASGEYHFLQPVRPGDTITTTGKVVDKFARKGRLYLTFELISKNQHGETVVINRQTSVWPR